MTTIDYSKYSLNELLDVQNNIDPSSPNYSALVEELNNRKDEILEYQEASQHEAFNLAEKRVKIIGYFQIAAAFAIPLILFLSESISAATILVAIGLAALNGFAGYTALKEQKKFYWVSIMNQSLQVFSVGVGSTLINYSGLGGIYFGITFSETISFGLSANFDPGFLFQQLTGKIAEPFISIDIMAVIFITALITVSSTASEEPQK